MENTNAYLIYGEAGLGKQARADELAKSLLNTENLAAHPDYTLVEEGDAKSVRETMSKAYMSPTVGNTRVIVLKNAEKMSTAAANSLLKTIEEPPETTVIIITAASKESLPTTVASRCRCIEIFAKTPEQVDRFLAEQGRALPAEDLAFCDGNIGKITRLLDDEAFRITLSDARSLLKAVWNNDRKKVMSTLALYDKKKDELLEMLPIFAELAQQSKSPALILKAEKANTAVERLKSNANPALVLNILSTEL